MKIRNPKQSRLRLRISPMQRTPESDSDQQESSSPCPESPPTSKGRSFKLSKCSVASLDLAETMKRRSARHQNRLKNAAMQMAIKLIYKYRCRVESELFDKCSSDEFASLVYLCPDYHKAVKPALDIFVKDSLDLQRLNRWEYMIAHGVYNEEEELEILRLFHHQNIDPVKFAFDLKSVLNCDYPKVNTFKIWGVKDSGKSLIAMSIADPFIASYSSNHGSENEFFLSNFVNKSVILCEELYVTQATCEDFKSILGGNFIDISKKHVDKQILSRTPIILTSNYNSFGRGHLSNIDEQALQGRCIVYNFSSEFKPNCMINPSSLFHFLYLATNQDIL